MYHGNLSINENEEAAEWLLKNVFNNLAIPFVIAGKIPSQRLEALAHPHEHTCLVANPSEKEMQDMIAKAQINILPSFNNTGIKLKLLNALYSGRHCLVNKAGVEGPGLKIFVLLQKMQMILNNKSAIYMKSHLKKKKLQKEKLLAGLNNNKLMRKKYEIFWAND